MDVKVFQDKSIYLASLHPGLIKILFRFLLGRQLR
jgi:hypothetical protein